jgi:hypothetical protein
VVQGSTGTLVLICGETVLELLGDAAIQRHAERRGGARPETWAFAVEQSYHAECDRFPAIPVANQLTSRPFAL